MSDREPGLGRSTASTVVVMACTMASRLLGFVRIALIAGIFGAGGKADILNLTFAVPNNLRKLLAEGALSSAFIPVLSESLVRDPSGATGRRTVRNITAIQLIVLIPLIGLAVVFARPLIARVLTELTDPAQVLLAAKLLRYFIVYLLLISIAAVLMAVLNTHGHFFVPAATPLLFSLCVIGATLVFHRRLDVRVRHVSVGLPSRALECPVDGVPAAARAVQALWTGQVPCLVVPLVRPLPSVGH